MKFEINIEKPFSFVAAIKSHGWFQLPPFYWDEESQVLTWAVRLKNRETVVRLQYSRESSQTLFVSYSLDDETLSAEIEDKFRYIMNLNLDLTEYYDICRKDSLLSKVPERGLGRLMRSESLYEDLFKSICGTNVQWRQAVKMIRTIAEAGDVVNGTNYRLFPTPQQVCAAGEVFLKERGRVGYRSSYLIDLAQRFSQGEADALRVESGDMSPAELKKYFLSFKGIGKTTAHYLMALYGNYEEMAVDSLVIKYMKTAHFNGETPTEQQIVQFYQKYGRWKYLIYWMEFIVNEGWVPDV